MKKFFQLIYKKLISTKTLIFLAVLYAIAMGVATFIENDFGISTARSLIYNSLWFELLMILLMVNLVGNIIRFKMYRRKKWVVFTFHVSFLIILLGAAVTRYISFEGLMPIREGEVSSIIYSDKTYIQTRVDDNKVMKNYGDNDGVLFGQIGTNTYSLEENFGKGESKIPFSMELISFVNKAREILVKDEKGASYLHIVESSKGARNDIYLKEGDVKSIQNILFTYNNPIDGGMNFTVKDGKQHIQSVFTGTYMEMRTQKLTDVPKDSLSDLQIKKLYTFNDLRFVVNTIAKGNVVMETAPKVDQKMHPYDALTFRIKSGEEEKMVTIKGASGAVAQPKKISLNGLNFNISYGSKELRTPFSLKLRDFELERYPGTNSASSYASEVTVIDKDNTFD